MNAGLINSTVLKYFFLCFVMVSMIVSSVFAQQSNNVVVLNHADSLKGIQIDGEPARELIGNVKFTQGKVVVTCERAIQYLKTNKVSFQGVVEVRDDSMRMVGMRGMYYADSRTAEMFERVQLEDRTTTLNAVYGKYFVEEKKAYFKTNVLVEDTGSVMTADELTYYREEQRSIADGNISITNKHNSVVISGDHFEHYKKLQYSRMTGHPKVIQAETASDGTIDTLTIRSRVMESYQDSVERLVATDSVTMVRSGFAAEAGLSIMYTEADSIVLRRSPVVWYQPENHEDNQVTGDSIFIKLFKRKLETVYVRGDAFAITRADSESTVRFNQLTGEELIMRFRSQKIHQIDVDRTATSVYYLFDSGKPNGMNKTSGDHITFMFKDGQIDQIKITGGVEGQYFPEKMVKNQESEYNLPGFNWRAPLTGKKTKAQ